MTFTITVASTPITIYLLTHRLMTCSYKGRKYLLMLDKELNWHCSEKLKELEEITEQIEKDLVN